MTKTPTDHELPQRLWRVPAYLPYRHPHLTPRAFAAAEKKLGVRLPRAYFDALRAQNGGYLRLNAHPSYLAPVERLDGIGARFPSITRREWSRYKEYMAENGYTKPERIDDLVPFSGDGHFFYCFDYRRSGRDAEPCVTYVDVESFDHDEVLAPDFLTFLHQLRADETDAIGLVTRSGIARVAAALMEATGFAFEDQGDQDHGYRTYRAKLPGRSAWAWLTPNRVKLDFARDAEGGLATRNDWRPGRVDRYPEHGDCGFFVSTSLQSAAGRKILRALSKLPFEARRVTLVG